MQRCANKFAPLGLLHFEVAFFASWAPKLFISYPRSSSYSPLAKLMYHCRCWFQQCLIQQGFFFLVVFFASWAPEFFISYTAPFILYSSCEIAVPLQVLV